MPLKEYNQKRTFKENVEPKGNLVKKNRTNILHFVVQKHDASHLHYDFRLEMDGVLKSWAIPKGPSLNPKDKRLAIQVEDHPYAYKDFEGSIPKGNYGAGSVIIWDEGNYEPVENNITNFNEYFSKGLAKGHLNFILHGTKLFGEFSLVKINIEQKNAWLLIKSKDNPLTSKQSSRQRVVRKKLDEKSVRSGLSLKQIIRSNKKNVQLDLSMTPKSAMPYSVEPMLATLVNAPFDNPDWIFEIKWDGYRIIAFVDHKWLRLYTRNHKDYTENFSAIATSLANQGLQAVFDGEMVVVDNKGRSKFELLQRYQTDKKGQLVYYIFDLIWLNGHDLHQLPLLKRKAILASILPKLEQIKISEHIELSGKEFFKIAKSHHLEGIIAKEANSVYLEGKRTACWLKIKTRLQQEAVICGYTAPRGTRTLLGSLVLGLYNRGQLQYIGLTGTGFSQNILKDLKSRLDRLEQPVSPFNSPVKTKLSITWVKPQLVCEVAFLEWTQQGYMRHPAFLGLRLDKLARSVHKESSTSTDALISDNFSNPSSSANKVLTINHHKLKLTNLNKILWPELGYTKGDLIEYYLSISKFILPYLKNRPQVLHRFPNGISEQDFYQKNLPLQNNWPDIQAIYSDSGQKNINYLICKNKASLIYMANLGCIDMNPWLSKYNSLANPDFCVIDLDPEAIEFEAVIEVASYIHTFLEFLDVTHYCKTSGATGLHIFIPINKQKYTFDQSKKFAELICSYIHHELPQITSMERMPKKRQAKVYLDFLQNRRGQTIAAPYSVRPQPGASVSTPLHWKEVKKGLSPLQFTIKNIHKRLSNEGDIWKPMLKQGVNIEKILKKLSLLRKF